MAAPAALRRIGPALFELPISFRAGMRVPARIFGSEKLVAEMDDQVFVQAANVATLPGIVGASLCMPDAHWGYGFPIGGVAAMDVETGVISPGGIGFDINCGMRLVTHAPHLLRGEAAAARARGRARQARAGRRWLARLRADHPRRNSTTCCAAGRAGPSARAWACRTTWGTRKPEAAFPEPTRTACRSAPRSAVCARSGRSVRAITTWRSRCAHRDGIHDPELARAFGIDQPEQVVVMFHCGSRGFGHQVATDYLHHFLRLMPSKFGLEIIDRELACAPFASREGRDYYAAMCCAANMSFANRQVILHRIREVFSEVFGRSAEELGIRCVYDVAHNTAKLEEHEVDGRRRRLLVHRKGATRAYPPGHPELPPEYRRTGQPVIVGGSMETGSYLLAGVETGAASFFSTAHGSGRTMSRTRARKQVRGRELQDRMAARGILVRAASLRGLAEEAGFAYKSVDEVAEATELAGLSRRVAHLVPVGNVKG